MGLQSGFVFAVIVAAVLAASHLGGHEEIGKRLFQLALAVTFAFAVISATDAFIRNPTVDESESILESSDDEESYEAIEDLADRSSLRRMVQFAAGVVALVIGLSYLRRYAVTALALTLGGVLLILFGGAVRDSQEGGGLDAYYALYTSLLTSIIGQASRIVDIAEFVVLAAGAGALIFLSLRTWDIPDRPGDVQATSEPPPL